MLDTMGDFNRMEMVHFIPPSQRRLVMLASQADSAPVLIFGSSGTGKGAIAKWIHSHSTRSTAPMFVASRKKPLADQIREAQGGCLVVTEVGELPLAEQKVLLNFLKTKSVPHPSNEGTPMLLNVRIIATSSQSLDSRAQGGLFNIELLKKLNVFRIQMPDLSKRMDEFEDIALGVLSEITHELHKEHLKSLSSEAWEKLTHYHWPGNVRELRNVLRVAVITAKGDEVGTGDLPDFEHEKIDFRATREEFEKVYILELLRTFNWQIDKTCQVSRINKAALLSKIKKYGIDMAAGQSTL